MGGYVGGMGAGLVGDDGHIPTPDLSDLLMLSTCLDSSSEVGSRLTFFVLLVLSPLLLRVDQRLARVPSHRFRVPPYRGHAVPQNARWIKK